MSLPFKAGENRQVVVKIVDNRVEDHQAARGRWRTVLIPVSYRPASSEESEVYLDWLESE